MSERYELELNLGAVTINDTETEFNWSNTNVYDIEHLCWWLNNENRKIADLEAKLAESEIQRKESEVFYKREINRRDTKLRNIKQQLAEKEKELEEVKNIHIYDKTIDIFSKGLAQKNQDKISFAVEQLEKVKDYAQHIQGGLINFIDNQIKQLKEMK